MTSRVASRLVTHRSRFQESLVPLAAFNRGFLSFAPLHQIQDYFGPNLPLEVIADCATDDFLELGWSDLRISARDTRAKFTDLARQGMDSFFRTKGLQPFEVASGRLAWWPTAALATLKRLSFAWEDGPSGSRQIVGRSNKRGFHWHYGVSCWARTAPVRHIRIAGRVIFTSDGLNPLGDARRLHRLRRSFCKSWRNDKWRDLQSAFWFWLADGASFVDIPVGEGAALRLRLPPMIFDAHLASLYLTIWPMGRTTTMSWTRRTARREMKAATTIRKNRTRRNGRAQSHSHRRTVARIPLRAEIGLSARRPLSLWSCRRRTTCRELWRHRPAAVCPVGSPW